MENEIIRIVNINKVKPNTNQPRKSFDEEKLNDLASSIKEQGILQPILVEEESKDSYKIIAGERRYRAAKMAELTEIPVIVKKFNNLQKMQVAIIENVQREELNPIEEAYGYMYLMREGGFTQDDIAKKIGKSRSAIANTIRLVSLQQKYVNSLIKNEITQGHARALLSVQNPSDRDYLYNEITKNNLNVRDSEELAIFLNNGGRINGKFSVQKFKDSALSKENNFENPINNTKNFTHSNSTKQKKHNVNELYAIKEIEEKFSKLLNTNVKLKGSPEFGKIQINYISYDELCNLYNKLGAKDELITEDEEL